MTEQVRGVLGARISRTDDDAARRLAPSPQPIPRPTPRPVLAPVPEPEPERRATPQPTPEPERAPLREAAIAPTASPNSTIPMSIRMAMGMALADGIGFAKRRATAIGVCALALTVALALMLTPKLEPTPAPTPLPLPQISTGTALPYPLQPAFEKPILEALAKGARIGWLKVRDYFVVDGDWIQVTGQGYGYLVHLESAGTMIPIPIMPGQEVAIVTIKSLTDGGGGVTLEVSTATGVVPLPPAPVGASITVPVR